MEASYKVVEKKKKEALGRNEPVGYEITVEWLDLGPQKLAISIVLYSPQILYVSEENCKTQRNTSFHPNKVSCFECVVPSQPCTL